VLVLCFQLLYLAVAQNPPVQVHCTHPFLPCNCPVDYLCGNQTTIPGIAKAHDSQNMCCPESALESVGSCRQSSKFDFTCCSEATRMCQYRKDVLCCNQTTSSTCGLSLSGDMPCCFGEDADCCAMASTRGYDCKKQQACCYPEAVGCKPSQDFCSDPHPWTTVLAVVGAIVGSILVCCCVTRALYRCRQRRGAGHQGLVGLRVDPPQAQVMSQVASSTASPEPRDLMTLT